MFINTKYLVLASEMTASGFSGPVNSVGWRWNVDGLLLALQWRKMSRPRVT